MNMKTIFYVSLLINMSSSNKLIVPEEVMNRCLCITIYKGQSHTIFLDTENDTEIMLKDCVIKSIHRNQSLLLLKGILDNLPKQQVMSTMNPNVVVLTKALTNEFLNSTSLKEVTKSHSNLLYIISAERTKFMCTDGRFNETIFIYVQSFMNSLWQKHKMIRVVINFPYTCPDMYVIYDGKKQSDTKLYDRTIKLIKPKTFQKLSAAIVNSGKGLTQGYPLAASIFNRFPTSILDCDKINGFIQWNKNNTNGFCGLDGLVLQDTINHFQFQVYFPKDEDCSWFGYINNETGVVTGSLGCVLRRKVDISFNSRFMVSYTNNNFYYLHYITHDSLCVLLTRPDLVPLWYYPYHAYKFGSVILISATIIALGIVSWISNIVKKQSAEKELSKLHDHLFDYVTCMLFGFSTKKHSKFYVLRGMSLACSLIILTIYQGHINYTFTTLVRFEKLNTLKQLYSSNYILHTTASVRELLKPLEDTADEMQAKFLKRTKLDKHSDINLVLHNKNVVTLGRKMDASLEIMLKYTDKAGKPFIFVLEDCFHTYFLSYITRPGFPFAKDLKIFMEHLLQAGIPKTYYRWTQHTLNLPDALPKYSPEPRPVSKLTMKDQRIALSILLIGYIVSTAVFIGEKWMAIKIRKNMEIRNMPSVLPTSTLIS